VLAPYSRNQSCENVRATPKNQYHKLKNEPSSTYPKISGEDLKQELFYKNKSKSQGPSQYHEYKIMVKMYQEEIARRWNERAKIKNSYIFPRQECAAKVQFAKPLPDI
jgi:hypothetical protein